MKMFSAEGWSITAALAFFVGISGSWLKVDPAVGFGMPDGTQVITLASLPYAAHSLEPYMSEQAIGLHYGMHHKVYLDNLNQQLSGSAVESGHSLEKIIRKSEGIQEKESVYDNAAQVWNHDFYWKSMKPGGGGKPGGRMLGLITESFGNYDEFRNTFLNASAEESDGGWLWLVQDGDALKIVKTSGAYDETAHGGNALLVCDVWAHAYNLDYQGRRMDYVRVFLDNLINWDFAMSQLK